MLSASVRNRGRTQAAASLRGFNAPLPGRRRTEDPESAARLRSLGYVTGDAPLKARYTEADDQKSLVAIDHAPTAVNDAKVSGVTANVAAANGVRVLPGDQRRGHGRPRGLLALAEAAGLRRDGEVGRTDRAAKRTVPPRVA